MKNNKFLLATLVAFVSCMVLGMLVYGFALKSFYESHSGLPADLQHSVWKDDSQINWPAMVLSNLAFALLLTVILVWGNFTSTAGGAKAGAIVCLLMVMSFDFGMLAVTNLFTMSGAIVDVIVNTIMGAVTGALTGMVLAKGTATATA